MRLLNYRKPVALLTAAAGFFTALHAQTRVQYNTAIQYQTMRNFAASDAWSCQFVGNWPDAKRNAIADWLFSMDTLANGDPKGIGLSLWRVNIGAGSTQQGDSSGIKDEWRRAAAFTTTGPGSDEVKAQLWFMQAARKRGVEQFLGFYNSPPVQFTRNGKAFATNGSTNIYSDAYRTFAAYTADVIKQYRKATDITFNYLSPVNEPQWSWSDGGQEGCPYYNREIADVVRAMNQVFKNQHLHTKLLVSESGQHQFLVSDSTKPGKGNQIHAFFTDTAVSYIDDLSEVSHTIASHSYFTTSPAAKAITLRKQLAAQVADVKGLEFWQSEYCILGDNEGEINGSKRDTGITAALYLAGVIHKDLVYANAAAWQWWLAISPYNYKDGLICIDHNKTDGNYTDSKMLWALGNYSRFIRPGMRRIEVTGNEALQVSGYTDKHQLILVAVNSSNDAQQVSFTAADGALKASQPVTTYTTSHTGRLQKAAATAGNTVIPAQSIVTVVINQ